MSLIKIKVKYSELRKRKIGSSKKLPMYVLNKPFFNILVYLIQVEKKKDFWEKQALTSSYNKNNLIVITWDRQDSLQVFLALENN